MDAEVVEHLQPNTCELCCTCTGCRAHMLCQKESGGKRYINPQETDVQAGPSITVGAGTVGLWVYILHRLMCRRWWRGLLQVFLGNKPAVRGRLHENMQTPVSLSLFSFSVSATGCSPSVHHPSPVSRDLGVLLYMALLWGCACGGEGMLCAQLARFLSRVDSLHKLLNFSQSISF